MRRLLLMAFAMLTFGYAQAQIDCSSVGITIEEHFVHDGVNSILPAGTVTYRMYATVPSPTDFVSSVFGDINFPMSIETSTTFYQDPFGGLTGPDTNPLLLGLPGFEGLIHDSWITIGRENSDSPGEAINTVQSPDQSWINPFNAGGNIVMNDLFGGSWFALNGDVNGLPVDGRVLLGQFTTDGELSGTVNVQVFPNGIGDDELQCTNDIVFGGGDVPGCTSATACNFDPAATIDDGSCNEPDGCTSATACNFDPAALCDDGSCVEPDGCTSATACNFDPAALCDDGSCVEPDGCTSATACNFDPAALCDDGSCVEPDGCTSATACNFDPAALCDDGSCVEPDGCTSSTACNFDPAALCDDGSCNEPDGCTNPVATNYDPAALCDDGSCVFGTDGCTNPLACNYNPEATDDDGSCIVVMAGDVQGADATICAGDGIDDIVPAFYDSFGSEGAFGAWVITADDLTILDVIPADGSDGSEQNDFNFEGAGPGTCLIWWLTYETLDGGVPDNAADLAGCFDLSDTFITVTREEAGCLDPDASNYCPDCCDGGECVYDEIPGCTDDNACNFDPEATENDGSCFYAPEPAQIFTESNTTVCSGDGADDIVVVSIEPNDVFGGGVPIEYIYVITDLDLNILGASESNEINFEEAGEGTCLVWLLCYVPGTINEPGNAGDLEGCFSLSNSIEITRLGGGCTNPDAGNYDPDACYDDGSCDDIPVPGCTNDNACNYDPEATEDDGSCFFPPLAAVISTQSNTEICSGDGEADIVVVNVGPDANFGDDLPVTCIFVITDPDLNILGLSESNEINFEDAGEGICWIWQLCFIGELNEVTNAGDLEGCFSLSNFIEITRQDGGCTDDGAANYDPDACYDDGSCIPVDGCQVICPENIEIECDESTSPENTGAPVVLGDCDGVQVDFDDDVVVINECTTIITRVWIVVIPGANETICEQTIAVIDTEGPTFPDFVENIEVECIDDVPEAGECVAVDNCNEVVDTDVFESNTGLPITECVSTDAIGPGDDWAIWLPQLYADGYAASANFLWDGTGSFIEYNDGTAHLFGTVVNDIDASQSFEVSFWFENRRNWDEWSALGRWYKDDLGFAQPDLFESWSYYEMVGGFSSMIGTNAYAGDDLYFYHLPENFFFGFQCGEAANNKNANFGASGWFSYTGKIDGEAVAGTGDINIDKECEEIPPPDNDCYYEEYVKYFWRAEDSCGNVSIVCQTVTVNDDVAPEFVDFPEDETINCEDVVPTWEQLAVDNCGGEVTYLEPLIEETPGECPQEKIIEITYSVLDECLNRNDMTWTITVVDNEDPVFTFVPDDATYQCDEVVPDTMAEATDNCDDDVDVWYTDNVIPGECPQEETIERTHYAEDDCGNQISEVQIINIIDTMAPVFQPFDPYIAVECTDLDSVEDPVAIDNCDEEVDISYTETLQSGGCLGVWYRIYTAVDDCGNEATAELYITILDTTPPTIECPEDYQVECDVAPTEAPEIPIYDNCGLDVDWDVEITYDEGPCPDSYFIIFTWTAIDYCENESTCSTTVTVVDTTDPEWETFPDDETYNCDEVLPEPTYPTASDNCDDEVEISYTDVEVPGECPQEYTIQRLWRGFDNCGNEVMDVQNIYIVDDEAPEFEPYPELTVQCDQPLPEPYANLEDNCDPDPTWSVDPVITPGECEAEYTMVRTYTAMDACGNESTATQTIHVVDTEAPTVEYDIELEWPCDDIDNIDGGLVISDNCSTWTIEIDDTPVSGGCAGRIIRDYIITDACGNVAEAQQIITLIDEVAPEVFNCPENATYECDEEIPFDEPTFEDNCDEDLDIVYNEEDDEDNCLRTITRTWTATDHCDNSTVCVQVITVEDTTPPEVFVQDFEWPCDNPEIPEPIEYDDNCNSVSYTYVDVPTDEGCAGSIERTYTVVDACDNETIVTQTITLTDDEAPVFTSVAPDETIQCDEPLPAPDATIEDNCDPNPTWSVDPVITPGECEAEYVMVRTYTAVDACGNESTATQTITVVDTEAPEVDYDIEIEWPCDDLDNIEGNLAITDNCSTWTVEVDDTPVSGGCAGRIIRDYIITDACGNVTEIQQIITLIDEVAPEVFNCPENATYECDEEIPFDEPTFEDNCDEDLDIVYNEEDDEDNCLRTITRTWTATDHCDNSTVCVQVITVEDTTPPEVFVQDFEWPCDNPEIPEPIEYDDNCNSVSYTYVDVPTDEGCAGSIERTYTVVDACDNETIVTQTITLTDDEAPVFTSVAPDETIQCDEPLPAPDATIEDNCDPNPTWSVDPVITPGECEAEYVMVRTYTAVDACGNESTATQTITVVDTEAPEVDYDIEIEWPCDDLDNIEGNLAITDNCSTWTVEVDDTPVSGGCAGRIIRDYIITDACGNVTEIQQIITLTDDVAPEVVFCPEGGNYECDELVLLQEPIFEDNCDDDLTIAYNQDVEDDGCTVTVTNTWTATDHCDNVAECVQVLTFTDTTPPTTDYQSSSVTVECDQPYDVPVPVFMDNCDTALDIEDDMVTTPGDCPQEETIVYTWTATDDCDNSTTVSYTVNITDNTPPVWTFVPQGGEYSCDEVFDTPDAEAEDNCGLVTVTPSEQIIPGECPAEYTLVITYSAVDECDNHAEDVVVEYYVYDDEAPVILGDYPDVEVECLEDAPEAPAEGDVVTDDNCSTVTVSVSTDANLDECGQGTIDVLITAVDACGNPAVPVSYTITIDDNTAPEFVDEPQDLVLDCEDDVPPMEECLATDNCDGEIIYTMDEDIIGDNTPEEGSIRDCQLSTPLGPYCDNTDPWSVRLFDMPIDGFEFWVTESGSFVEYEDGTAHLQAVVSAQNGDDAGWIVDVWFEDAKTWEEWYVPGMNNFKDDCGNAEVDLLYLDWIYYIMTAGSATMTGTGDIAGSFLNLVHAPSNEYYAYQVGASASNVNLNNNWSNGGWFTANGEIVFENEETQIVDVSGDFAFAADCCPDYEIVRTWTATDCAGNTSEVVQIITFDDLGIDDVDGEDFEFAEAFDASKGDVAITRMFPNPTADNAVIDFGSKNTSNAELKLYDMSGNEIATLYRGTIEGGLTYRAELSTSAIESGVYTVMLVAGNEIVFERLVVAK